MRFMLCARDRATGTLTLVSDSSFPTRREAIEAISDARDISGLSDAEVFLVDLDAAVPVAVVPYRADEAAAPLAAEDVALAEPANDTQTAPDACSEPASEVKESDDEIVSDAGMRLGFVEIDIEAWTCEDCIYTATCAKVGTIRPAECAAFQWRA
jgi:hypothetical protein